MHGASKGQDPRPDPRRPRAGLHQGVQRRAVRAGRLLLCQGRVRQRDQETGPAPAGRVPAGGRAGRDAGRGTLHHGRHPGQEQVSGGK